MRINRRDVVLGALALPVASACAQTPEAAALMWRQGPDAPYAVQEIYPAVHDGGIWVAGGFSPQSMGATARVIVFDIAQQRWREGPRLPAPAHHVHLTSFEGALWAIGGYRAGPSLTGWTCTERVLRLEGGQWVDGPALPKPVAEAAPIVHQGRIHIIGGRSPSGAENAEWSDQTDIADHFVLAPGATQWEAAAPLPMARNSTAVASVGGAIHVISGRTVAHGQTAAHHIYDARSGAWSQGADYPDARGGLAAAYFRGRIVVGGGEIFEPRSVGASMHQLDGASWSAFETMPVARHGHGFIVADDALYAIGGAQRTGGDGTLARLDVLAAV